MKGQLLNGDWFYLTHEILAHMLGVPRVGVTNAASELHQMKLVDYSRGNIKILDRKGLRRLSVSVTAS